MPNQLMTMQIGTTEYNIRWLRIERNKRLAECDWTQIPNNPLTQQQQTVWANYRQALRDMPENTTFPMNEKGYIIEEQINWPEKPE
jgi:hypothetical protein